MRQGQTDAIFSKDYVGKYLCKQVLPSKGVLALLGPVLTSRVILCAPFLEWIEDNMLFLPKDMEHFDGTAVRLAMAEWNERDDGCGWGLM